MTRAEETSEPNGTLQYKRNLARRRGEVVLGEQAAEDEEEEGEGSSAKESRRQRQLHVDDQDAFINNGGTSTATAGRG